MDTPHSGRRHKAPADRGGSRTRNDAPRSLVFVSPAGSIPLSLVKAVEHEFDWLDIALVSEPADMDAEFESPVALFLVDGSYLSELTGNLARRNGRRHPHATTAIVFDDVAGAAADFPRIRRCDFVQGVLLMNLKLDVWLSVLGVLLRGGEYFPTALLRLCPQNCSPFIDLPAKGSDGLSAQPEAGPEEPVEDVLNHLTVREGEVAELMARGAQNKAIAADLGLSAHTVKIHVGNIIRKLRARNRTEAVANLLRSTAAGGSHAGPS